MPLSEGPSIQDLRRSANRHVWLDNHDWSRAEVDGGPMIAVGGEGLRVTDAEGRSWIDVTGGQGAVNIGYGRTEMADVIYHQMAALNYMPQRSAIPSTIDLARKLAEITPGTLNRTFPVSSGARGQRDGNQGRQGLPPAQRRTGPLQDRQQVSAPITGTWASSSGSARLPTTARRTMSRPIRGCCMRLSRTCTVAVWATSHRRSARCDARRPSRSSSSSTSQVRSRR